MPKTDNSTPMPSSEYDKQIAGSMPYYNEFGAQAIDLVKQVIPDAKSWLDTGCGTGTLGLSVLESFPGISLTLADPSEAMLEKAREKYAPGQASFITAGSQELDFSDRFDVITAIQCNHYMKEDERQKAVASFYKALHKGGIFISFENICSDDPFIADLELRRWERFRIGHGFDDPGFRSRMNANYFPISVEKHFSLMKQAGFSHISLCWRSYMQMGIYGIK